jgi:signal peptidase II
VRDELQTYWIRPFALVAGIVAADQITKALVLERFGPNPIEGTSIPISGEWLKLTYIENTGVAFGMFQNFPQIFTVTSILISLGAIYYYRFHLPSRQPLVQLCLGLIIGGAIGNIIDRLRFGYVVDFVHISWFPGIFNLADSAITVGTLLLAVFIALGWDRPTPDPALTTSSDQSS